MDCNKINNSPVLTLNNSMDSAHFGNRTVVNRLLTMDSSEWHMMTDSEREQIQRERRKANAYKTALCKSFKETGNCQFGDACRFAHGENELRLPPQAHPKYKTQLCNKFVRNGYCQYGGRCQFIHDKPNPEILAAYPYPVGSLSSQGYDAKRQLLLQTYSDKQSGLAYINNQRNGFVRSENRTTLHQNRFDDFPRRLEYDREDVNRDFGCSLDDKTGSWIRKHRKNLQSHEVALQSNTSNYCRKESSTSAKGADLNGCNNIETFTKEFDDWMLNDSSNMFSQSCFPRIQSIEQPWCHSTTANLSAN